MNVKKRITDMVLLALEKSLDGYFQVEDFAYNPHKYIHSDYPKDIKKSTLAQALKRLREKGFIELIDEEKLIVKLTDKGRDFAILKSLEVPDDDWDGKWRIVCIDIPEERKKVRNVLRNILKKWGFWPKQKSVWVSKKNCTKYLRQFIKEEDIESWVLVIESSDTGF